jgi:hypothetical protein
LLGSTFAPAWLPKFVGLDGVVAAMLATLGVGVLGLAWVKARPAAFVGNPWALIALALLLGIDNLIAGASRDVAALSPPVIIANSAATGLLATAACAATGLMFRTVPQWGAAACGLMLVGLAVAGIG